MDNPITLLPFLLPLSTVLAFLINPTTAVDFVFNGFNSAAAGGGGGDLLLYSNATVESRVLTLTKDIPFSVGRALYPSKIPAKEPNSALVLPFSTSFIFSMVPYPDVLPGHGIVFLFTPASGIDGVTSSNFLGLFNFSNTGRSDNHVFGVEFDVFANQEYGDINDNHVGIDVNSLTSIRAADAGYFSDDPGDQGFKKLDLNDGGNYQVWIDYIDFFINVTMAPAGIERPTRPLINVPINLSDVFLDKMYVGFTAATGRLVESHKILGWSFSNTNFSLSDQLVTAGLPSFVPSDRSSVYRSRAFVTGTVVGLFSFVFVSSFLICSCFIRRKRRGARRRRDGTEGWELEYWPHRICHQEIDSATNGFAGSNVIGTGGKGKVYRGVLASGGAEVAVKCISPENHDGTREFLAEVSSLGRLKHRNLVGLRGWCKREDGNFMLVYDYMENGSLDKWVFGCPEEHTLSFRDRIRVLKDAAHGVLYLHEGWEARVLHRDIKSSNVLLDKDMNARLGDFGLARIHTHGQVPTTTQVVGTVGYLDPEVVRTGRASAATDVFGFGVLILEVMCGRRPIEEGKPPLMEWVLDVMSRGELGSAIDGRVRAKGGYDPVEAERVLHLGLMCGCPDPSARPTMRQVVKVLEGNELEVVEGEDTDYLLDKVKSKQMWAECQYPTLKEIQESLSSSISLTWSDLITEGR